jgi:hypothetical protein
MLDLNMVPFFEMQEPLDEIDQIVQVPDLNLMPKNIIVQHQPMPIPAIAEMANLGFHLNEVFPQDPISMEVESFGDGLESQGQSVPQEEEQDPQPMIALPASPLSFLHLDILPHELNATDFQGDENDDYISLSCQAPVPTQQGSFFLEVKEALVHLFSSWVP